MARGGAGIDQLAWQEFYNDGADQIPPFAVMRVAGAAQIEPGRLVLLVGQPDAYGSQWSHVLNSHVAVPPRRYGFCTGTFPAVAQFAEGTAPHSGELWGPRPGSWELHRHVGGFVAADALPGGRVLVLRSPLLSLVGRTAAEHLKGALGTVRVWHGGVSGSELDSGEDLEVYNRFADLEADVWVTAEWVNGRWELGAGEC